MMNPSKPTKVGLAAVAAIIAFEGFMAMPYKDIAGIWTDGYGNTENVVPGRPVTKEQAKVKLEAHADKFAQGVIQCAPPQFQSQLDGYTVFTYNLGVTAFCSGSIAKRHNQGDYPGAALAMTKYDMARVNGKLVVVRGLALRRYEEYNMVIAGLPKEAWRNAANGGVR